MPAPTKCIVSYAHLNAFLKSQTHTDVLEFVTHLSESVHGKTLSADVETNNTIHAILAVLDSVSEIIDETPVDTQFQSRFGNPAFRKVYDTIVEKAPKFMESIGVPEHFVAELSVYFVESWGNRTRIDYGSGMELNFICWLLCLEKLHLVSSNVYAALVLRVYYKYLCTCIKLEKKYWLEPAGSHGAQGLDDYHFAVFLFGAAQLYGHKYLRPKSIHDPEVLYDFAKDYMYLQYITHVNSTKSASLRWHSPMLDDISAVKRWEKVAEGMIKMYDGEVLSKLPVVQHFLFGELLQAPSEDEVARATPEEAANESDVHVSDDGTLHVRGQGFGDCCGIRIPSAFAAAEAERAKDGGFKIPLSSSVRRVPFD